MIHEHVEADRLYFPSLSAFYAKLAPFSTVILRLGLAGTLFTHGWAKIVEGRLPVETMAKLGLPMPYAVALFIGCLEFFGPILLALGLFTRLVGAMIFVEMMVISFGVLYPVYSWGDKGYEFTLMIGLFALGLAMNGGGRYALDRALKKEL
jgi:putative oxidoreductase